MVDILEDNLEHYSNVLEKGVLDKDMIRNDKSTGAKSELNPMKTTGFGFGELIKDA